MTEHLSTIHDFVRFGEAQLAKQYTIMHSHIRSDKATLSRLVSYWPEQLYDVDERRGQESEAPRLRYSPRQFNQAIQFCDQFVQLPFEPNVKRMAVHKALRPSYSWRKLKNRYNFATWQGCRDNYDNIIYSFVLLVLKPSVETA